MSLIFGWLWQYFFGIRFRVAHSILMAVTMALAWALMLCIAKRRAEGKPARQFGLLGLLIATAYFCSILALGAEDRRSILEIQAKREQLQQSITTIVGNGTVRVSGTTLVQVKRPAFNDDDLKHLIAIAAQLEEIGSPLNFLDVCGTSVTDQGIRQLATVDSLEYCFLERTSITDASINAIDALPRLRVVSAMSTAVTPERLFKLSQRKPELNISPKSYQRFGAAKGVGPTKTPR